MSRILLGVDCVLFSFSFFFDKWKQIISDLEIVELIAGAKLECNGDVGVLLQIQTLTPKMNATESAVINKEIDKMIAKGVISACEHHPQEVLSPVFIRIKKDGTYRMVLNLKKN